MNRKELKTEAKKVIRKHYLLSVIVCLLALLCTGVFINQTEGNPILEKVNSIADVHENGSNVFSISDRTYENVIRDLYHDDVSKAQESATRAIDSYSEENSGTFGRSEGILAKTVNLLSSGQLIIMIYNAVSSFVHSPQLVNLLLILAALAFEIAIVVFFKNMVHLVMARIFMEESTYDSVPLQRVFYFSATGKWIKSALSYLKYQIYLTLWSLTVIGGFIKQYSYAMVPYILAENPDMTGSEAITLSRKMMDGHKWEMFCLDLSMIGWFLLDFVTVGIAGIFWCNPYYTAVRTQYYRQLRAQALEKKIEGSEKLNDTFLFEQADDETLTRAYRDVKMDEMYIRDNSISLTKIQDFFVRNFSIWIGSSRKKNTYQAIESIRAQSENDRKALDKKCYPSRLSPLYQRVRKHFSGQRAFIRAYTVPNLILIFFAFAFIGWVWEVALFILTDGVFVNRGTLIGPYLPIYGVGAVLAIILFTKLRNHPIVTFGGSMVLSGVIEYSSSYMLEKMFGLRWWDYTGYFLNLDGRICLEGLVVFGIGCLVAIYVVAPALDNMLSKANTKVITIIAAVLIAILGADVFHSVSDPNTGKGITTASVAVTHSESI